MRSPALILLCPLEAERAALVRSPAWRGLGSEIEVAVTGPGGTAVEAWFRNHARDRDRASPLVLVGVAGALVERVRPGEASFVGRVVAPDGRLLAEPSVPAAYGGTSWCVASVDVPVATPQAKEALAARSGAEIVDMESAAFAEGARRSGRPFAIIRGISDGREDTLPDGVETLVDRHGRTRVMAALTLLTRQPRALGPLRRLARQTGRSMDVAAGLVRLLRESCR